MNDKAYEKRNKWQAPASSSLVDVSIKSLGLAAAPLIGMALLCWRLSLVSISRSVLEGCVRTFVQLTLLGSLLRPIFQRGKPWMIFSYCSFLVVLASYEASSRTKYEFEGQFWCVFVSLALNVAWVALLAFGVVLDLRPRPWNPRYVVPIVGMLLGNSIGAISLSLDALTKALAEQSAELELYQSAGASKAEATARILQESIMTGATPVLNMMRVTGIISIPGMMTGNILGGSPAYMAARYQILIIYLIALCTLGVILFNAWAVIEWVGFDVHHEVLRSDRFVKSRRKSVMGTLIWLFGLLWNPNRISDTINSSSSHLKNFSVEASPNTKLLAPNQFQIRSLNDGRCTSNDNDTCKRLPSGVERTTLSILNLSKSFAQNTGTRVLFSGVDLNVSTSDLILVSGASGSGKSTLFRGIAGVIGLDNGDLELSGVNGRSKRWHTDFRGSKACYWRRDVRYVTQSKVSIGGTPSDFIDKVSSFSSWGYTIKETAILRRSMHTYLSEWGLGAECLDKEWSQLSGGESQRVMIAMALASKPRFILFDESTSALDKVTKVAVEKSVQSFVKAEHGGVLWISHDEDQAERMAVET